MSAFGGSPDIGGYIVSIIADAFDPKRTSGLIQNMQPFCMITTA
jgi:hypothetical protein